MGGAVEPVYGEGFFHVAWGVIYYTIIYDYRELDEKAARTVNDPRLRAEEERYIARTMQELMDEERIVVNGADTRCIVDLARLERRAPRYHSAVIHARIPFQPVRGNNVYENFYGEEEAPYPYTVYWIAPPGGKIVSVDSPGDVEFEARERIAIIRVRKGTRLPGYEAVVFRLEQ